MSREMRVTAEWAVWGKRPGTWDDYEILHCSEGQFSHDDFREIMIKWAPGTLADLPQVTISWVNGRGDVAHVGLAIQSWSGQLDGLGRPIAVTTYYCVPYAQIAGGPVSYEGLYRAFSECALPVDAPLTLNIPVLEPRDIAGRVDETAMGAAALLLADEPVCVVGGEFLPLPDRLRYLDTVAALLPYGLRTRLTASTWTDSSTKHRIKLSFAKHPLEGARSVTWGTPESDSHRWTDITRHYFDLLTRRSPGELVRRLARQTEPVSFKEAPKRALALLDDSTHTLVHSVPSSHRGYAIEDDLHQCADLLEKGRLDEVGEIVERLRYNGRTHEATEDERERYREIVEGRLLAKGRALPADVVDAFYGMTLVLAYGRVLTVEAMERVQEAAGQWSLPLIEAMRRMPAAEPAVSVRLAMLLGGVGQAQVLESMQTPDLVEAAAREPFDPALIGLVHEQLVERGGDGGGEDGELAPALGRHAYLASASAALHARDPEAHFHSLRQLLVAAYGRGLDQKAVNEIVSGVLDLRYATLITAMAALYGKGAERALVNAVQSRAQLDRETRYYMLERLSDPAPEVAPEPEPRRGHRLLLRGDRRHERSARGHRRASPPDRLIPPAGWVLLTLLAAGVVVAVVVIVILLQAPHG
ncbi:hypothetical protein [Sphaerisporangium perillae]|uniref:hypothetical protein n=1 Tax=Sphaerisporangium perillae TaxID=2935860 RepID=UPI00201084CA|nr:hypothetical protein [Sphaerisporangium perillae]